MQPLILPKRKPAIKRACSYFGYYLFITYIVTSNPKRISVADGVVHIVVLLVNKVKYFVAVVLSIIILEK